MWLDESPTKQRQTADVAPVVSERHEALSPDAGSATPGNGSPSVPDTTRIGAPSTPGLHQLEG